MRPKRTAAPVIAPQQENTISRILGERAQGHATRAHLYEAIERKLKLRLVCLFTSFVHPVMLDDADCDTLDKVLRSLDLSPGLALVLSSPGGSAIAAERIIRVLRAHSGKNSFACFVPGRAKSAATLVAFGAREIYMGGTSELGPVDPQMTLIEDGAPKRFAVHTLVRGYETLFAEAIAARGRIEPYLQQLNRYDARQIGEMKAQLELADSIAVKALATGMLTSRSQDQIRRDIAKFLTPEETKAHARPICADEAAMCGMTIRSIDRLEVRRRRGVRVACAVGRSGIIRGRRQNHRVELGPLGPSATQTRLRHEEVTKAQDIQVNHRRSGAHCRASRSGTWRVPDPDRRDRPLSTPDVQDCGTGRLRVDLLRRAVHRRAAKRR